MPVIPEDILPAAITKSNDYADLTDKQRHHFAARLYYCKEIAEKAANVINVPDSDLLYEVDDIELDAQSIMSSYSDVDMKMSPWLIHTSWTFETDNRVMTQYVGSDIAEFLRTPPIGFEASGNDIRVWLKHWSQTLLLSLNRLAKSSSFTEAMVHLILIDAVVSSYLVSAAIIRLLPLCTANGDKNRVLDLPPNGSTI
jgi:hypothetical protein